ncbi:MAG: hypothetical protein EBT09_06490 [Actinobacteria bacterium]|nr:hypothetical protein [Actinomycetota bacterium]
MNGAEALVGDSSLVVVCGSGGVGKTTMAAALGTALATTRDSRVLVLTVDPARRLADALGLSGIGNEPVRVDLAAHAGRGTGHSRSRARQSALSQPHRAFRALTRLHRHGTPVRRVLLGELRRDRRRHATVAQRARRPRRATTNAGVLRLTPA